MNCIRKINYNKNAENSEKFLWTFDKMTLISGNIFFLLFMRDIHKIVKRLGVNVAYSS